MNRLLASIQKREAGNVFVQNLRHRHKVLREMPVCAAIRENHAVIRSSQQEAKTTIRPTWTLRPRNLRLGVVTRLRQDEQQKLNRKEKMSWCSEGMPRGFRG